MNRDSKPKPTDLLFLLQKVESYENKKVINLVNTIIETIDKNVNLENLWDQPDLAITNWILLLSGVNQKEEIELAKSLLFWKGLFSKDTAQVLCVQSSDHIIFHACISKFKVVNCPTLLIGNTPSMDQFIKIESQLLTKLIEDEGGFQRFLNHIHNSFLSGKNLIDLKKELLSQKFWSGIKLVYSEIKGLLTFNVGAKADL